MSSRLAIVRAAHLHDYLAVLRDIGAPVDRDLARSRLPPRIEETPDLYISLPIGLEWVALCGRDLKPMELGFLASRHASFSSLNGSSGAAILMAATGLGRLEILLRVCGREDSALKMRMRSEAGHVRVICEMIELAKHPFLCLTEWLTLQGIISVVRSFAGPGWSPQEMTFVSRHHAPEGAESAMPSTRILVGQGHTSILIERDILCAPPILGSLIQAATTGPKEPASQDDAWAAWTFVSLLRSMIQPYLNGGHPDITLAAESIGMSKRTLQRKLQLSGCSYSQIVQEARFELARSCLGDPSAKVIDVAMMSGYESPQHFTRAFRRFTGVTPTAYRRTVAFDA